MDRRRFLALTGAALTAGCTDALPVGSTPTPSPTASPTPTATPEPFARATNAGFTPGENPHSSYPRAGGLELARGEYVAFAFRHESRARLQYAFDVVQGGAIDVLVMGSDAFGSYRRGDRLSYFGGASSSGREGSVDVRLPAGEQIVVFDNTYRGPTTPSGTARLRYGLGLGARSTPTPEPTATPFPFRQASDPKYAPEENPFADGYGRSGGLELPRGTFHGFFFESGGDFTLRYAFEVASGGAIDALVMSESAFGKYAEEADRVPFYANASATASTGAEIEARLPGGSHAIVFDNTYLAARRPSGSVRVLYGFEFG